MQTTAIRTVAKSLPQNKVILLTCLISNSYIPYTDLQEYLALNTEGYVVVAERLVFCDAMQRQRKVSHLLNVHTNRLLSIFLLLTVEALHLHAELIGKDSVEEDADDSGKSQA